MFFAVRTSKPVRDLVLFADSSKVNSSESVLAVGAKACLVFSTAKDEQILMKVALSFAGFDGAMAGLQEIPDWDFDSVRKAGELAWEKELEKLQVSSEDRVFKEIFYTAVYHSYLSSMRFDDAQGKYRGANGKIHNGENTYSVFGLWDTYLAIHPLYTLTQVEKVPQIINSFLVFCEQYGLLPVWVMAFCETHCMTGYHAIPVIADAILKGIGGFQQAGQLLEKPLRHEGEFYQTQVCRQELGPLLRSVERPYQWERVVYLRQCMALYLYGPSGCKWPDGNVGVEKEFHTKAGLIFQNTLSDR